MASASARADSAVSSTATRADGPWPGLRKSMFSVCPAGAGTGWAKYTLASLSVNHPAEPLPLPATSTFSVGYVHMGGVLSAGQGAAEKVPDLLPAVGRGLGPVRGPVHGEE